VIYGREDISRLIQERAELTLAEAMAAIGPAQFGDATLDPEDYYIVGERLGWGGRNIAAGGAGIRTAVGIKNQTVDPKPGALIVTSYQVGMNPAAQAGRIVQNPVLVGSGVGSIRDSRWSSNAITPVALLVFDNTTTLAVIAGNLVSTGLCATSSSPNWIAEATYLGPAQSFAFVHEVDNAAVSATFWWREFDLKRR